MTKRLVGSIQNDFQASLPGAGLQEALEEIQTRLATSTSISTVSSSCLGAFPKKRRRLPLVPVSFRAAHSTQQHGTDCGNRAGHAPCGLLQIESRPTTSFFGRATRSTNSRELRRRLRHLYRCSVLVSWKHGCRHVFRVRERIQTSLAIATFMPTVAIVLKKHACALEGVWRHQRRYPLLHIAWWLLQEGMLLAVCYRLEWVRQRVFGSCVSRSTNS